MFTLACALAPLLGAPVTAAAQADARDRLLVSTAWLANHVGEPGLVLLHVGDADDYQREHIPGAVFLSLREGLRAPQSEGTLVLEMPDSATLERTLRGFGIGDRGTIVLYWGSEWVTPTTRAMYTLLWAGLGDRTVLLDGGLGAWKAAGQPVTAEVPTPAPGNVTVRPRRELVVTADWVQSHADASGYRLVDARSAAHYDGVREDQGKAGHIPGAGSLSWTGLVDEQVRFRPASDLRALFDAAGVKPGDTVVAYCHIGQYATAVLFAARTLGHDVLLYDGAFQDWAARGLPVEAGKE
jgi:thiosulfate/3-mercaptopyruvate sulfurtransferase